MKGLKEDGLGIEEHKPQPISQSDVDDAIVIFAVGCTLPSNAMAPGKARNCQNQRALATSGTAHRRPRRDPRTRNV
jgi:hypothetical protein